ncbi:MAG: hypothetical protein MRY21_03805 [Simkaniaceae bacterium]|nr:hypothetical protein [Simkaniaceae bacterium]
MDINCDLNPVEAALAERYPNTSNGLTWKACKPVRKHVSEAAKSILHWQGVTTRCHAALGELSGTCSDFSDRITSYTGGILRELKIFQVINPDLAIETTVPTTTVKYAQALIKEADGRSSPEKFLHKPSHWQSFVTKCSVRNLKEEVSCRDLLQTIAAPKAVVPKVVRITQDVGPKTRIHIQGDPKELLHQCMVVKKEAE